GFDGVYQDPWERSERRAGGADHALDAAEGSEARSEEVRSSNMVHTYAAYSHVADKPRPAKNYLNNEKGIWSWMTTVDHKRIGVMYLVGVLSAFLIGGIFALLVRLTLLNPQHTLFGKQWITADAYNRVFTLHGAIMVFLFIIPSVPAA